MIPIDRVIRVSLFLNRTHIGRFSIHVIHLLHGEEAQRHILVGIFGGTLCV